MSLQTIPQFPNFYFHRWENLEWAGGEVFGITWWTLRDFLYCIIFYHIYGYYYYHIYHFLLGFYWVGELGLSGTGGFWHLCTWWTLREFSQRPGPQSSIGLRLERSFHLQISAKYKYREDFPSSDLFKYKYIEDFFSQERKGNHSGGECPDSFIGSTKCSTLNHLVNCVTICACRKKFNLAQHYKKWTSNALQSNEVEHWLGV